MNSASNTDGSQQAAALEIRNICKEYRTGLLRKKIRALSDVSIDVPTGSVFALLGPNGSGKTTLLKIIIGLCKANSGHVRLLGQSLSTAIKRRIGFLPDNPHHYGFLSAAETLSFYADVFGFIGQRKKEHVEKVLALVKMQDKKNLPLRYFSKGMLQRIALAQALINDPELLILDEPVGALDPGGVRVMKTLFETMKKEGKTVIFSSHLLNYAEEICDRFVILDKGRVVYRGNMKQDSAGRGLEEVFLSVIPRGE